MAAFAGINSAVDVGIVKYVSAHKVKVAVLGESNQAASGVTLYIDFTKDKVTTYVLTATIINTGVHATNEYEMDSSSTTTPAAVSKAFSATKKLVWPIALPADGHAWLVLTGTYTGSAPESTDIVLIEARRDTVSGS
jgi:hypothetical protein